jgi:lipopolysaccharide transport system permease protein
MRDALNHLLSGRDLWLELAYRDLRVRYKQSVLGVAWALFTPVVMMLVFTHVFARVAKIDTGGIPYPIYVFCGLLPWHFLANSLKGAVESLTRNRQLVTKIYMPRGVFPLAQIISSGVDFLIATVLLLLMMVWYEIPFRTTMLFVPILLVSQIMLTIGLGLILSMGNLFYRDVKYLFDAGIMLWMFATSVVYPMDVNGDWGWILALNPMTAIIDGYRDAILRGVAPDGLAVGYAAVLSVLIAGIAIRWFHEAEHLFAEYA